MITLDEVLAFSTKVPGPYSKPELTKLYELAVALPDNATVVEIGVLYGRSASVFFQVAQHKPLELHFIDPWVVNGKDPHRYFHGMVNEHFREVPSTMHNKVAREVFPPFQAIDLLHVDGDHSPEGIESDCELWLYGVRPAPSAVITIGELPPSSRRPPGYAVFHDYDTRNPDGGLMYPQIKETVDHYCADWEKVGVFDSQAIFRRKP